MKIPMIFLRTKYSLTFRYLSEPSMSSLKLFLLNLLLISSIGANAQTNEDYLTPTKTADCFVVSENKQTAPIVISENELSGVLTVAGFLKNDMQLVGLPQPEIVVGKIPSAKQILLIGTLGHNSLLTSSFKKEKLMHPK